MKPRREIDTPWRPSRPDELQVIYSLSELREREQPISVDRGVRSFRWASRLSLSRARSGRELYLETEPEWRLYDELRAKGLPVTLKPGDVRMVDPDDPRGRARICVGPWTIRYDGAAGFRMETSGQVEYVAALTDVMARVQLDTPRA